MKKRKSELMITLLLGACCSLLFFGIVHSGNDDENGGEIGEELRINIDYTKFDTFTKHIATFSDLGQEPLLHQSVKDLAYFLFEQMWKQQYDYGSYAYAYILLSLLPETQLPNLEKEYFYTLLRHQNPYTLAFPAFYFETDLRETYCKFFDENALPFLGLAPLHQVETYTDDEQLEKDYKRFLIQLFVLAQQDTSGRCWNDTITIVLQHERSDYLLPIMIESALLWYVTLCQKKLEEKNIYSDLEKLDALSEVSPYFLVQLFRILRKKKPDEYKQYIKDPFLREQQTQMIIRKTNKSISRICTRYYFF